MEAEPAEPVAGVILAAPDDDLTAAGRRALSTSSHLAICTPGAAIPDAVLLDAAAWLDADHGLASISLLDRAAVAALEAGHDHDQPRSDRLTHAVLGETLRQLDLPPVSVAAAGGPVIVVSRHALSLVPGFPPADNPAARINLWSAATARRALTHLVSLRSAVEVRSQSSAPSAMPVARLDVANDPALDQARRRLRVAVRGMRVHIDGRTLEAAETGTEVHTLQLIKGLAQRPEIEYLGVNLRGDVPEYAREVLAHPSINTIEHCGEWRADLPQVDVFHRPYQPLSREDCDRWRAIGARTATDVQDLITYLSPDYHPSTADWHRWRRSVHAAVTTVDGAFTISEYVREQMIREGLRGPSDPLWVAPNGVDHVTTRSASSVPAELEGHRLPFALVLGSTYGHKNVDLAVAAVDQARSAGCELTLVTAGRQVDAATPLHAAEGAVHLGRNVAAAERNWLLANAAVVVFPTSAEGFGLIPFEAAAYGTPTVCVTFGALGEYLGELPVHTADWSVDAFSRSIQMILADREAGAAQVSAVRRAAVPLTWDRTAAIVLDGYREILRRPARA